jgi:hypothetical protein
MPHDFPDNFFAIFGFYRVNENNPQCQLCKMYTHTRSHHLTPRCKGGKETADICETCESFIHKTWTHNELRDTYNSIEVILADEKFQRFLKWRLKQPATTLFKSNRAKNRDKNKYH